MFIKEIGLRIKLMDMVYILTLTEHSIKAIGKKISKMDMGLKHGLIKLAIKEIMNRVKSKVLENLHGLMALIIRENFKIIIYMAKVYLFLNTKKLFSLIGIYNWCDGRRYQGEW